MAIPIANPFPLTGDPIFDSLTNGGGWLPNTASGTLLTWALADSATGYFITLGPFETAVDGALAQISAVANVQFVYLGYGPVAAFNADIVVRPGSFSAMYGAASNVVARAYFPLQGYGADAGDVWLNVDAFTENYGLADLLPGGKYSFVILHELGHALGLKHPHDSGGTGRPTFVDLGLSEDTKVEFTRGDGFDIDYFTVMSYNDETNFSAFLGDPATLMPLDIYAMQGLYGPNLSTNAGDSHHFLYDDFVQEAVWDASGVDVINLTRTVNDGWIVIANAADAPDVDLPDVLVPAMDGWTLAVPYRGNLSGSFLIDEESLKWVYGAEGTVGSEGTDVVLGSNEPDVALGGGGDDALEGYGGNDMLGGGAGDDALSGGAGIDTATFWGAEAGYELVQQDGVWTVTHRGGADGTDLLTGIERLQFADKSIAIDLDGAAGDTAKLIGAIFGEQYLIPEFVGIGISFFDAGWSMQAVARMALNTDLYAQLAGSRSNADFVRFVYQNVVGFAPNASEQAYYQGFLDRGDMSQAQLAVFAAETAENAANIDLIGLSSSGIEFIPFGG